MAAKSFRLVDTAQALEAWVDGILADTSRHHTWAGRTCPVVAVDTETTSLDTRILIDMQLQSDGSWELTYEVQVELAGVCLSADGLKDCMSRLTTRKATMFHVQIVLVFCKDYLINLT